MEKNISYDRIDEFEKTNSPSKAEFKAFLESEYDEPTAVALLDEYGYE